MSFENEENMYDCIKNYLENFHYRVKIDKPRGSGVKFRSLKGWIIDAIGVKKGRNPEVIAIEAKNDLGSSSVLDALSKAEMYRNACTKVYVAFPKSSLRLRENKITVREIRQECQRRGIGMLEVGKECKEVLQAVPSSLRVDMLRDLLNEIELNTSQFDGFEEEDFARYFSEIERKVVWHKFELLVRDAEKRLKPKGLVITHNGPYWYSFSRELPSGEKYWHVPHFTLSLWVWEGGIMTEFITREGRHLNSLKRKIEQEPELFNEKVMKLKSLLPSQIKVEERVHIGGYSTEKSLEFAISSEYINEHYVQELRNMIIKGEREGKIWLWIGHLFHFNDKETHSDKLVNCIEEFIDGLMELYDYINIL